MQTPSDNLRSALHDLFGHDDFRAGQREIVEAALAGRDLLAVLPTGGGKSVTFQLPAMLAPGATLVLSPLIALMKDQLENLPPVVAAQTTLINSTLDSAEISRRMAQVKNGQIKMIYAAPERLRQPPFLHALRQANLAMVVVDEAHCISQWGHDFRPDYRSVGWAIESLQPRSVLAVTATATPSVADDIEHQLGRTVQRIVHPTFRDNLFFSCRKVAGEDEKLVATVELSQQPGSGLIYAMSRDKCESLARMLRRQGVAAGFYHAGLPPDERAAAQDKFRSGEYRVMVATVAFGMGVDKSDIRFLVHYHPSRSLENYYQEAGRAGRDGQMSNCTLLYSVSDATRAQRHQRDEALTLEQVKNVYTAVRSLVGRGRIGAVPMESLFDAVGGDENLVRSALPLLEEMGMIARHVDLPRRITLMPVFGGDDSDPEFAPFRDLCDHSTWEPAELARASGVPLPDLEPTLLRLQERGRLSYRGGSRDLLLEIVPAPDGAKQRLEETLQHRAKGAAVRTDAMISYARDPRCRHAMIARYFGDRWHHLKCGACDVCAGQRSATVQPATVSVAPTDPNIAPLAALRVIADLASGYNPWAVGKAGLVKILRGTPDAPVNPNRTAQFGTMSGFKKGELERLTDALIERGYLRRDDDDEYRRLYLTEMGSAAVREKEVDIEWRAAPAVSGDPEDTVVLTADQPLYEELRWWRTTQATEANVPGYCVFPDKVLKLIAFQKPANEIALLKITGIGPVKAGQYGEGVLQIVRKHIERG